MTVSWYRAMAAVMISVGLATSSALAAAPSTQPSPTEQQLIDRINALETEVHQLKAEQQTQPGSAAQAPASGADALQQINADAERHTNLFDVSTGLTAGWNASKKQFYLASEDGNFYLHPGIIFQARYAADYRRTPDTWQNGFELRRMKFYFDGFLFTPDLTYKFQWQDGQSGGTPTLEYGWAQYVFLHDIGTFQGDVGLKVGQTKNYVFKEQAIVADTNQPLVERSMVDSTVGGNALGGPLIEGVDLVYTGNNTPVHLDVMFNGGDGSGLTNFTDVTPAALQNNFGAAVRGDWKIFGKWADNSDLTGQQATEDFLDIGAGIDFSEGATAAPVGTPSSNTVRGDVDAQYTHAGRYILYGSVLADAIAARGPAHGPLDRTDAGALVEGGYFLNAAWELVARYDATNFDHRFKTAGRDLFQEAGVGVNWFLGDNGSFGNHAKVTFDADYLPFGNPALTGLDYLASPSGRDAIALRGQFQLWF
jgi:hypothetical protein